MAAKESMYKKLSDEKQVKETAEVELKAQVGLHCFLGLEKLGFLM